MLFGKRFQVDITGSGNDNSQKMGAEIAIIRELRQEKIVSEVKWVRGQHMLADVMTKRGVNPLPLIKVMQQGRIDQELLNICMN